jgi:hypothetical protein
MKNELKIYSIYLIILIITNFTYKLVWNKNNRIEYYFFENNRFKYKLLKYCRVLMNIVMYIYLRFVLLNLINSYKWNKN